MRLNVFPPLTVASLVPPGINARSLAFRVRRLRSRFSRGLLQQSGDCTKWTKVLRRGKNAFRGEKDGGANKNSYSRFIPR